MRTLVCLLVALGCASRLTAADPSDIFEKRILPIFNSPNPSSCVQCHLAGVDLKNYIRPSHRETFLSLRDQGLVDLDAPEKSRILALITMGKEDAGAKLIHKDARKAELDAFAAWLKASAADQELRNAPKLDADKLAKPVRPDEVIRHARKDRLIDSFTNNVWAMRFRCMSCHHEGTTENKKHVAEFGERVSWFKAAGPEATLKYLMDSKLIDVKNPDQSLLLRKPLNEVKHEGGIKFLKGDEGYKAYRRFIEDYAAIVGDQYAKAEQLPKRPEAVSFGTDIWFKMENTPPAWGDKLVAVKLFAWDAATNAWEVAPIATTDRKVWGQGKLWQHNLTLHAARDSERAKAWVRQPSLPSGRYLVKVYLDADERQAKDWTAEWTEANCVGQAEVRSVWSAGYGKMTSLDAAKVRKE